MTLGEVAISSLAGIVTAWGSGIFIRYWDTNVRDHVKIRRIKSPLERHVEGVKDLYEELFPDDGSNYSREEISDMMHVHYIERRHVEVENITLVALWKDEVVGFMFVHYYPEVRKAIVSYLGVTPDRTKKTARAESSIRLMRKLKSILTKKKCAHLLFDLQGADENLTKQEKIKRKARGPTFANRARELGLWSGEFRIAYTCPKATLTEEKRESAFYLHCIPIDGKRLHTITKEQMIGFLEFIYLYCYADFYPADDARFKDHYNHLHGFVDRYRQSLPNVIDVTAP